MIASENRIKDRGNKRGCAVLIITCMLIKLSRCLGKENPQIKPPPCQWVKEENLGLPCNRRVSHISPSSVIKNGRTLLELFSLLWPKIPQWGHSRVMFTVISLADWRSTKLAINAQLQPVLQRSGYLWFNEDNTPRHRLIAKMSSSPTEVYLNNYLTLLKQFSDFGWTPSKIIS